MKNYDIPRQFLLHGGLVTKRYLLLAALVLGSGWTLLSPRLARSEIASVGQQEKPAPGGYVLESDKDVARNEPGTHNGGGDDDRLFVFQQDAELKLVFRKRAFKPGSAIGYHLQREDEIYYVLSGRGIMTDQRQGIPGRSRRCDSDSPRQLARPEADRQGGSGHPHQLRTGASADCIAADRA